MWDKDRSVIYLNSHAGSHSQHRCAEYTREAIEAGGIRLNHHLDAKDYGDSLTYAGFVDVTGSEPEYGDIVVIQPYVGRNSSGHMAMFNGRGWVSDFKQHDLYPGSGYRKNHPPYKLYRYNR
ncbi:MAG: hypothetical protein E7K90_18385 [Hafnia alvei]|uniref:hypothetical protein n=1 Tax=Hafnia alvei TaxID=569 RepID=UPI0029132CEC|nr:hypothetical protein [Hafnia alvei]MDU7483337.1 hypothetical protein [Hafnia alvei]